MTVTPDYILIDEKLHAQTTSEQLQAAYPEVDFTTSVLLRGGSIIKNGQTIRLTQAGCVAIRYTPVTTPTE